MSYVSYSVLQSPSELDFPALNNSRIEKFSAPNDQFFLQRSYPDAVFDLKGYEQALQITHQIKNAQRTSTANGFNAMWVQEGPGNIGGRVNALAVHPSNSNIILSGHAAGGIFKSTNGGNSWYPVFDDHSFLSIACIVFDPVNPNIVYAGTGDPNIPGSAFIGDGIYKSTNAGESWFHLGLTAQRIISKIVINPNNTNEIYAATMGLPYIRNNDRGLYKSTNGGASWSQVLFISDDAGITDLVMDINNPQILYAAGWNRIRNNQESLITGQAAKVYKTTNGGATWNILANGLPQGDMSRISLAMSGTNSNVIYAQYVDTSLDLEGIYKTTNGGATWNAIPISTLPAGVLGGFGWYFGNLTINPTNDDELYLLGVDLYKTTDGGVNWNMSGPSWWTYQVHADKHALVYINNNTQLLATDGGIYKTTDAGQNWVDIEDIPNTQFYRIAVNPHATNEYWGGAQDNGTTSGNSATLNNWIRQYGADGFQPIFHPTNPLIYYMETQNGNIVYTDDGGILFNGGNNGIDPGDRRNWDMPVIMSKHNPDVMYTGTFQVLKNNGGTNVNWTPISPDLTDGLIFHPRFHNITTVAESPVNGSFLYAGTSDGNVWRTLNGGTTWNDVTASMPDRYVTSIKASNITPGLAYVTHSGYRYNDFLPHIHKTTNNGTSWTDISGNLPPVAINSVLPYPGNDNLLFVATDGGVFATIDAGNTWNMLGTNMPVIPVYDLALNNNLIRLVAGTFARSMMTYPVDSLLIFTNTASVSLQVLSVNIFPNPTADFVNVTTSGNATFEVQLYNVSAALVANVQAQTASARISLKGHPAGVYYIKVTEGSNVTTRKIVRL